MQAADLDDNGTLDYEEFLAAMLNAAKLEREENLMAAFETFDVDGNGRLSVGEIMQVRTMVPQTGVWRWCATVCALARVPPTSWSTSGPAQALRQMKLGDDQIRQIMREVDQDGNGEVDYNEFALFMRGYN